MILHCTLEKAAGNWHQLSLVIHFRVRAAAALASAALALMPSMKDHEDKLGQPPRFPIARRPRLRYVAILSLPFLLFMIGYKLLLPKDTQILPRGESSHSITSPASQAPFESRFSASRRVSLEAHIMSKCPDARDCLRELVVPAMEQVAPSVQFQLSFIGEFVFSPNFPG